MVAKCFQNLRVEYLQKICFWLKYGKKICENYSQDNIGLILSEKASIKKLSLSWVQFSLI